MLYLNGIFTDNIRWYFSKCKFYFIEHKVSVDLYFHFDFNIHIFAFKLQDNIRTRLFLKYVKFLTIISVVAKFKWKSCDLPNDINLLPVK